MTTETINIVVTESGSQAAAKNVASIGEAATVTDKSLNDLLAASGTTTTGMAALATAAGTSNVALTQLSAGSTAAAQSLLSASQDANVATRSLGGVASSSGAASEGMNAAGASGTRLVLAMRSAASAAEQTAVAENSVAGASARAAVGMEATSAAAAHGATAVHHMGEESEVLQNKLERLELTMVALGLALGAHELIEVTDKFANMNNQLERIKVNAGDFANKQNDILRIAQATRQPLEAVNSIYVDMSISLKNTSISAEQISRSIQTLSAAATISGKSVSETSSALQRLGLAMRQGDVSGRGFLQFLLQFPEVGDRVAVALGFVGKNGFGNFVKAVNDGKIHTEEFVRALNSISPEIDKEMKHMEVTIASAFVVVKNAFLDYIGRGDAAAGVSSRIAEAVLVLAKYIPQVVGVIATLTIGLTAYGVAVGTAALATGALAFSFAGIVGIIGAVVTAFLFFGDSIKVTSDGSVSALQVVIGVFKSLAQWAQELYKWLTTTSAGMGVLTGAVIVLTGALGRLIAVTLVGWITAAVSALITFIVPIAAVIGFLIQLTVTILAVRYAWVAWKQGFDAANKDLENIKQGAINLASTLKNELMKNITDSAGGLTKALKGSGDAAHDTGHAIETELTPSIVRFGQSAGGSFKELGNSASGAINVINGFQRVSPNIIKIGTDADDAASKMHGATDNMNSSLHALETASHGAAQKLEADFETIGSAADSMASKVVSDVSRAVSGLGSLTGSIGSSAGSLSRSTASGGTPASPGFGLGDYTTSSGYGQAPSISPSNLSGSGYDLSTYSPAPYSGAGSSGFDESGFAGAFAGGGDFIVGGSGGTDSQVVKFVATPGERVTVETSAQQRQSGGGSTAGAGRPIVVQMTVNTPDANSFRQSETQMMARLANKLARVQSQLGE